MFTRVVEFTIQSGKTKDFSKTLYEKVLPILKEQRGFMDEVGLISNTERDRILALSFWDNQENAERYNREHYPRILDILNPLLKSAPKVTTYTVDLSTFHRIELGKAA
jgi:quinol monooxygenase YgiN